MILICSGWLATHIHAGWALLIVEGEGRDRLGLDLARTGARG